jgi:hypothetical protein
MTELAAVGSGRSRDPAITGVVLAVARDLLLDAGLVDDAPDYADGGEAEGYARAGSMEEVEAAAVGELGERHQDRVNPAGDLRLRRH